MAGEMSAICPECGSEAWDLDCNDCNGDGYDDDGSHCEECDGLGFVEGSCECSSCGYVFDE